MYGSDMALFAASQPTELVDAHVVSEPFPKPDDCSQDWELISSHSTYIVTAEERQAVDTTVEDETFLMFEARRKLNTGDPQDIALIRDTDLAIPEQRIISAWGDTPEVSFHGVDDVSRGSIRLYKTEVDEPDFDALMARDADGSFFVGARNFTIPANDTTYQDFCITRQDLIDQGVPDTTDLMSVIGFRPIVDDGPSARYVHHYVTTGIMNASEAACNDGDGGGMDLVYVWAPGDGPFALPEFLGSSLFGEDGFQGFNVEIHYDNPNMDEGIVDSSGVEIFFSTTPRETEVAVLQVGDPFIQLFSQPVGEGYNMHQFDCPGSCSNLYLQDDEPVTVIREYLHMHATGARMTNEQIRNGEVVRTAATEVWDFDANGNIAMKQDEYKLQPGDGFRTKCYFNGEADTVFGLGSREEMCIAFLYYYPRKKITVPTEEGEFNIPFICGHGIDFFEGACNSPHSGAVLENEASLNREFGKQKAQCLIGADQGSVQVDVGSSPAPAPDDGSTPVTPGGWPEPDEADPAPAPMGDADSDSSPAPAPEDGSTPVTPGEWPEPDEADPSSAPVEENAAISSAPSGKMLSSFAMMGVGLSFAGFAA